MGCDDRTSSVIARVPHTQDGGAGIAFRSPGGEILVQCGKGSAPQHIPGLNPSPVFVPMRAQRPRMMLCRIVRSGMLSSVLFLPVCQHELMYLFGPIFDNSVLFVDIDSILQCTSRLACFHFGRRARNLAARQSCTRMLCSHGGRLNARK
ncbi:uncharacterized protein K489DRAFT_98620 [Dissoconium aciculare CBS 342.82]|uniref:Uncharacterized protein n=1 Tax=Dissoconium aciculare CBS 342.82 TaxID=1314786 RepID=A0A6J3MCP0_9PEZI|nr:uncharacterized protein K489DRAFT_98620 [Dissoconium aciculare CBS 342.82]KAF1825791.1 hypothetical protein K489DRAFT_98620 [Dissoconium aciculare CBS 342.82]